MGKWEPRSVLISAKLERSLPGKESVDQEDENESGLIELLERLVVL